MSVPIVSRAAWGAKPWNGDPKSKGPAVVPLGARTEFFVHYDGARHITATGNAVPQAIDRQHQAQGWAGIGYSFVVDQAGTAYEGRGWHRQGAHCPGHNISGLSVQIAIGGDQEPTEAALATARALYDEACQRTGRTLAMRGHRDGIATQCPGDRLYEWVKDGMPVKAGTKPGKPTAPNKPKPTPPKTPTVSLARLIAAARRDPAQKGTPVSYAGARIVEEALAAEGLLARSLIDGHFGTATRTAYGRWQARQGYRGADADGIPGRKTLTRLAARHGFIVAT
ncbi:N-acetylmuramoyl-L-alanine amidase [Streptomyces venezuelae]|uniref:N-acetylmuramoyl-L-alanine amidase n=1 Tax=Streptomyces sp. B6(2022) TaxID=3404749 RepID=UPI00311F642C